MPGVAKGSRVEIRLLGEPEVLVDGRVQPLPASKKTRALLGYLVSVGRAQRRQRLCDLLWDGPDDPRAALRWSLAKLRPMLDAGRARLLADREHVGFACHDADVDVLVLAKLRHAELAGHATSALEQALARFRGPFLEGLELVSCPTFQAWCVAEREGWRALQVRLITALAERRRDEPEASLRYARAWVALDPLAEAPRALVMDSLAALGEPRRVLTELAEYEEILRRELGTEPSLDLQRRRMALARSAPSLRPGEAQVRASASTVAGTAPDAAAARPDQPAPGPAAPLVGRERERHLLDETLQSAERRGRVLLITGEPGIGKSRLLEELAAAARRRGGHVFGGRAFEAETVRPYGPIVDALREAGQPSPFGGQPSDRTSLYDEVVDQLAQAGERRPPAVLLLDDAHWIDEASAELTHYLVRRLRDHPVLVAVALRPGELADNPAAARLHRSLARTPDVITVTLGPLAAGEIKQLLGPLDGKVAERLSAECGGNPFLALELARAAGSGVPDPGASLSRLIAERFAGLRVADRALLGWLAALGRAFDVKVLAQATGLAAGELATGLERLEHHGILRCRETGYDFAHDLVRQASYRQLSAPRRQLLHAHIARALAGLADADAAWMSDVAHHAALGGDAALAVRASVAAARRCLRLFAFREAAELAARAEPLAVSLAQPERVAALVDLAEIRLGAELRPDVEERLTRLAAEARALGMAAVETRAFYLRSVVHFRAGDPEGALDTAFGRIEAARHTSREHLGAQLAGAARCCLLLEKNLKVATDFVAQAESLLAAHESLELAWSQGTLAYWQGKLDEAAACMGHALALARREHAYWEACEASLALAWIELDRGRPDQALAHAAELADHAGRVVEGVYGAMADGVRALVQAAREPEAGFAAFEHSLPALHQAGANRLLAMAHNRAAQLALRLGENERAERHARAALASAETVERAMQIAAACVVLAELASARADQAAARLFLDKVTALVRIAQVPRAWLPALGRVSGTSQDGDGLTVALPAYPALRIVSSP